MRSVFAFDYPRGGGTRSTPARFFFAGALALALCLLWAAGARASAGPAVERVEPPGWWAAHPINPVRLLVYGRRMRGATARTDYAGVRVLDVKSSEGGNHLFLSLDVSPAARPGPLDIEIQTAEGSARARFDLKRRVACETCFRGFSTDDVIYLIMPDRFSDGDRGNNDPPESRGLYSRANPRAYHGGDLQGVIDRLPYLKRLGVTAIWMTPFYDNTGRARDFEWGKDVTDYHGYGAVDFYRVEERLGTLDKLRELVTRAHALGIKIIQDQVANHTGPDHPWAADPPTPSFLNGTADKHLNNVFDIKAVTDERPDRARLEATLRGWFADRLPDINQDDAEAARYVIQNAVWWVESTGLDAIRQDTFPYAPRRFWADWNRALQTSFPRLTVVGEVFDQRPEVTSFFQGGRARFDAVDTRLHTVFDFPSYFAMRDVFIRDQSAKRLTDVLDQDHLYTDPRVLVTFFGNHDVTRFMSEKNATAERLILAFTYLLTTRGTPQIYYGDEIAMEGRDDPDNRRDFPGGFPGDGRDAFSARGRTEREQKVFNSVSALLALRARHAALRGGRMRVLAVTETSLAYLRERQGDSMLVAINNSDRAAEIEINFPDLARRRPRGGAVWTEAFPASGGWRAREAGGKIRVPLSPRESKILVLK